MFETLFMALIMAGLITLTMTHFPLWIKRVVFYTPDWFWAAVFHFGYAGWIGGVTGHSVGLPLAVLMYLSMRYYLHPKIGAEMNLAWENNYLNRFVRWCRSQVSRPTMESASREQQVQPA